MTHMASAYSAKAFSGVLPSLPSGPTCIRRLTAGGTTPSSSAVSFELHQGRAHIKGRCCRYTLLASAAGAAATHASHDCKPDVAAAALPPVRRAPVSTKAERQQKNPARKALKGKDPTSSWYRNCTSGGWRRHDYWCTAAVHAAPGADRSASRTPQQAPARQDPTWMAAVSRQQRENASRICSRQGGAGLGGLAAITRADQQPH